MSTDIRELAPGARYVVVFSDCCVEGQFEAVFESYELDEEGDPHVAVFDTARVESLWGGWTVTLANAESAPASTEV